MKQQKRGDAKRRMHQRAYEFNRRYVEKGLELCEQFYPRISQVPPGPRTVAMATQSMAFIDNGGFAYLFNIDLCGDFGYEGLCSAYRDVGAVRTAELLLEVIGLFPGGCVPDEAGRIRYYQSVSDEFLNSLDERYYHLAGLGCDEDMEVLVAQFIRSNRDLFE